MRKRSAEYRRWSLDDWCSHVTSLGAASLTEWASKSRSNYNRAVTLGLQRQVAQKLGWLPRLESGDLERMTDTELAHRFRERGVASISDMWRAAQHWCEFLRREGRLEAVAEILGFGYAMEYHPADLDYYLERCSRVGDLSAWCLLDRNAADAARRHGLMEALKEKVPRRSSKGYPTAGGFCISLPELAVARLLEANDVAFTTGVAYPFTFPRGKRHACRSDFYLNREGAFVEVWSVPLDERSPHWEDYVVRRRFKTEMCHKLNLRLINLEGWRIFRPGPEAYLEHVHDTLSAAGLTLTVRLERWAALMPETITEDKRE